jgi:hypothetical protein
VFDKLYYVNRQCYQFVRRVLQALQHAPESPAHWVMTHGEFVLGLSQGKQHIVL